MHEPSLMRISSSQQHYYDDSYIRFDAYMLSMSGQYKHKTFWHVILSNI